MKKIALIFAFVFTCGAINFAQTPTPVPKPAEDDDVVKISTNLIQVDVTVTDKNGKIISDLKPEDFEIYENGERQEITNFSFVANVKTQAVAPTEKNEAKNAVPLPPSAQLKPEQVRRTVALVVDDLSLSFQSTYYVRRALRKFVEEQMQPGDLAAIIRTGAGIGALQQFTSDKHQLLAAIERVRWNPNGTGGVGAFAPIQDLGSNSSGSAEDGADEDAGADAQNGADDFRESVFATGTLGALDFIVRGMRELPGRKSVMLMSDGFQLFNRDAGTASESLRVLDALRRLVDLANRASVVIYTMDARGLQTLGLTAEDNTNQVSSAQLGGESSEETAAKIEEKLADRRTKFFDSQEGLVYLARQTGGTAFYNNNDLSKGIERMLDDQSYYLIGYQPDAETFDAATRRFNKLTVNVKRKGARIRYRSGFFGVSDERIDAVPTVAQTPAQQIRNALVSPFAVSDISLRLNALYGNDAKQGNFVRSLLHVNAKDLKFTDEPDGGKKAVFNVLALSLGENGNIVDQISKTYTLIVKDDAYQKIISEGFVYNFVFPVKKAGAYQYRVAIHDVQAQKVGSANQFIEVPNLEKKRLTLSGIVLENLTRAEWQKLSVNAPVSTARAASDSMTDTSLRKFKRGTVLRYGFEVYNAKLDAARKLNLTTQARIFRDGKLVFEGKSAPFEFTNQSDLQRAKSVGTLSLGSEMEAGDYILQIVVTDNLAKTKRSFATQFVQFEIE